MRTVLFSAAVIAGVVSMGIAPVKAVPSLPGIGNTNIHVAPVENVGYRRRYYRRYGYPVPYAYYPPPYGYYVPPSGFAYPPPRYYPPPVGDYVGAPPPEGDYADAPEGDYADGAPPDGDYAGAPPPEGY
jgi:hypothetical protein